MHLLSAAWSLIGSLAYLGAVANAAGVLDFGIVFPRPNETYAPTDKFPVVFALQNAALAKNLGLVINTFVRSGPDLLSGLDGADAKHDLKSANFTTSEPYFVYHFLNITGEGLYELFSTTSWARCDERDNEVIITRNSSNLLARFEIKKGAQMVDLVAATADNTKTCPTQGFALNVTDETREAPEPWDYRPSGTCAVLNSSSPTPTANPCRVKIDSAASESMYAALHTALCKGLNPPADCPKETSAAQQVAVASIVSIAAALGAVGFLLA
ncbi:hypothetical protein TWF481_010332 [Arthrobotrys musiformis]|uniref:DUF7136 domain-containing protein n=1 Tax=Arthrobotrys musiformis TaxID=47236 RepID=A0AAV9W0N6_9PEZI